MSRTPSTTEHVQAYLSFRRSFGFQLDIAGYVLRAFARFADREATGKPFTVELALRWAQSSLTGRQVTAARRLLIRCVARRHPALEELRNNVARTLEAVV